MAEVQPIERRVRLVLAKTLGVSLDVLPDTCRPAHDLGSNSLELVEFVMDLEDNFSIVIDDDEAPNAADMTVADWVALVQKKLEAQHAPG